MLDLKRRVSIDIETNALYNPTLIHCIVCTDIDSDEVFRFRPNSPKGGHHDFKEEFLKFSKEVCLWIGHNIVGFDMIQINRLMGEEVIKLENVVDTLILSRLFMPVAPKEYKKGVYNRTYGHSLEAWGKYLNFLKFEYDDWSKFSEEMLKYCIQDTKVCQRIYFELMEKESSGFSNESIRLEHYVAYMLKMQEDNGFFLDQEKALRLYNETSMLLQDMLESLQILFPPLFKLVRNLPVKLNKDGSYGAVFTRILENYQNNPNLKAELKEDGSYDLYQKIAFNPNSGDHIAERLLSIGWKPTNYTAKGNIKTDKKSLEEAIESLLQEHPDMESLRCLANFSIVGDRNQKAAKWLELAKEDGRVHGKVNPIGAGTHRCSHYDDNMANIARVVSIGIKKKDNEEKYNALFEKVKDLKKFDRFDNNKILLKVSEKEIEFALTGLDGSYGWDSRDCWGISSKDMCLVGADASGIQLRALAHYMNDKDYIKKLLEGDIHTVNQLAAGISTRNKAKTFIYAWLLGGGDYKIGLIVGVTEEEYEALFEYARNKKRWNSNLLEQTKKSLRDQDKKADRRTVATIIKGFKTKEQFLDRTPALKRLKKKDIPAVAKQGYMLGLDGRKLWIPSEHLAMSLYLQGFEAVIMKKAMYFYQKELNELGIPFKQVAMIHDEFQIETPKMYGDIVGKTVVEAIRKAGEFYHSNCPLDGEYKVGNSWSETH